MGSRQSSLLPNSQNPITCIYGYKCKYISHSGGQPFVMESLTYVPCSNLACDKEYKWRLLNWWQFADLI